MIDELGEHSDPVKVITAALLLKAALTPVPEAG